MTLAKKRINTLAALTLDRFGYWCYTLNNRNGYCEEEGNELNKFLALTEEKRLTILNAAFQCFGKFGYEKPQCRFCYITHIAEN